MSRRRRQNSHFVCPCCGADVPTNSAACPACGADEETGWQEDADVWGADLPQGWSETDPDAGSESEVSRRHAASEFGRGGEEGQNWRDIAWKAAVIIIVALLIYRFATM